MKTGRAGKRFFPSGPLDANSDFYLLEAMLEARNSNPGKAPRAATNAATKNPLWRQAWLSAALLLLLPPGAADASKGHVLAKGVIYQAATYIQHPQFGTHPSYYGCRPEQAVDINIGINSDDDEGMPLFAPEDGTVRIVHHNTNAWGWSLEWRNLAGTERFFLAHLKTVWAVGAVRAGEQIAEIGGTGGWKPHLHIESSRCWLELGGSIVAPPVNPSGNGMFFVSNGPADSGPAWTREFFAVAPTETGPRSPLELGGSRP